jgi:hypothetical protein
MSDLIDVSQEISPIVALIDAFGSANLPGERRRLLVQLRERVEASRSALREHSATLDALYEQADQSNADADSVLQMANATLEKARSVAEKLNPGCEFLGQKLAAHPELHDPDFYPYFQESLDIAANWSALYRTLYHRLLKLASERRIASGGVLRARPVEGDINHEALSREFMARFPKIRAALAK